MASIVILPMVSDYPLRPHPIFLLFWADLAPLLSHAYSAYTYLISQISLCLFLNNRLYYRCVLILFLFFSIWADKVIL